MISPNHSADDGDSMVSLRCVYRAFPNANIRWSFRGPKQVNATPIRESDYTILNINDTVEGRNFTNAQVAMTTDDTLTLGGLLIISNVTYDDDGTYICTAFNNYGEASYGIRLRVRGEQ